MSPIMPSPSQTPGGGSRSVASRRSIRRVILSPSDLEGCSGRCSGALVKVQPHKPPHQADLQARHDGA
jgi:hypothetical protein